MAFNIDRSNQDPFYRYKMPRLIAKVEGKGNGIKTVMVNMVDIAKALSRPPTYPTKFFGCELGAQTQFDLKNDRYIVNGCHDSDKLQSLLDGFIKKFVLCPECSNPETNLIIQPKKQLIMQKCIACGHQGSVDMNHKLTTFILKNPPDMEATANTPVKGKGKKAQKKKDEKRAEKEDDEKDRASPEANAQQQMAAQRASGGDIEAPPEIEDEIPDDDWGEDVSEEAVNRRMEELTDAAKGLTVSMDLEKTPEERLNIFYELVKKRHDEGKVLVSVREMVTEAERLEVKEKAPMILVELLLNQNIMSQMTQYKQLFRCTCANNPKAQKYLLGGLEQLIGNVHKATLLPKVPHIFKGFYDMDVLDEAVLIEWSKKVSKKYIPKAVAQEIHDKAAPFIKWLMEAEEEESDSEEEDDNLEVVYTTSGRVGTESLAPAPAPPKAAAAAAEENEGEDIDIDNI